MAGSMGGMMDDMMRGCRGDECGRDRRLNKLLYPQLMALPDLPPERRASVEQLAHHRMREGIQLLASLSSEASHAVQRNDYGGLQEASDRMRVAWGEFDSGLSAYRALAEGQAPRGIALAWFRSPMLSLVITLALIINFCAATGTEIGIDTYVYDKEFEDFWPVVKTPPPE